MRVEWPWITEKILRPKAFRTSHFPPRSCCIRVVSACTPLRPTMKSFGTMPCSLRSVIRALSRLHEAANGSPRKGCVSRIKQKSGRQSRARGKLYRNPNFTNLHSFTNNWWLTAWKKRTWTSPKMCWILHGAAVAGASLHLLDNKGIVWSAQSWRWAAMSTKLPLQTEDHGNLQRTKIKEDSINHLLTYWHLLSWPTETGLASPVSSERELLKHSNTMTSHWFCVPRWPVIIKMPTLLTFSGTRSIGRSASNPVPQTGSDRGNSERVSEEQFALCNHHRHLFNRYTHV